MYSHCRLGTNRLSTRNSLLSSQGLVPLEMFRSTMCRYYMYSHCRLGTNRLSTRNSLLSSQGLVPLEMFRSTMCLIDLQIETFRLCILIIIDFSIDRKVVSPMEQL
jgi:hypothetical protein